MRYGEYNKKDFTELKKLWKNAFHDEDSYIEYYFQNVVNRNMIFAAWDEEKLVSMVHLNPYTLICSGKEIICHYIVGVATIPEYRQKGIMKKLLQTALVELQDRGEGFTYLMPAKEEYYYGLGFRCIEPGYIICWKDYLEIGEITSTDWHITDISEITDLQWDDFNHRLSEQYDLFVQRNAEYMIDLKKQCQSLSGDIYIVSDHEKIVATMGIMYEAGRPQCVQYITTEDSLLPMRYVEQQLRNGYFTEIEIFGNWVKKKYPELQTKHGKGIMYKILDQHFSNIISYDKMLMINEVV